MRRLLKARQRAQHLLAEHDAAAAPVNVLALAERYARVVNKPLGPEVSGALVPLEAGGWLIMVNSEQSEKRQRFTVAHELGHLLLHEYKVPHADRSYRFRDARSSEGSAIDEIQANQFAAELLMPEALLRQEMKSLPFEHAPASDDDERKFDDLVSQLAERFRVSRQAMAIRLSSLFA